MRILGEYSRKYGQCCPIPGLDPLGLLRIFLPDGWVGDAFSKLILARGNISASFPSAEVIRRVTVI